MNVKKVLDKKPKSSPPTSPSATSGFNSSMLSKALISRKESDKDYDDSENDGWSDNDDDDDEPRPYPNSMSKFQPRANPPPAREGGGGGKTSQTMTWKERNEISMKERRDERRRQSESKAPPVSLGGAKPQAAVSVSKAVEDDILNLKAENKRVKEELSASQKKVADLSKEKDALLKRIVELQSDPSKQRRDSVAFEDTIKLMSEKTDELDGVRGQLLEARKTIEDLQRAAKYTTGSSGAPGSTFDSKEVSSLREALFRAKKDKDKALKLVIKLVGKNNMAQHMKLHETTGDGLSSLVAEFGNKYGQGGSPRKKKQ